MCSVSDSLSQTHLIYCLVVWQDIKPADASKLERIQETAVRVVYREIN